MSTFMLCRAVACAVVPVLVLALPAHAIVVQGTELAPYSAVSTQLGTSHGVVFASANYPAVTFTELMPGLWGIQGAEPWALPSNGGWYNSPIIATFVDLSDGVTPAVVSGTISANWGDGGGDFDAVDMRLYDASNALIASQTFSGSSFTLISMNAVGVRRVEFWPNTNIGAGTSDTGLDWLSFDTPVAVPSPGAALLFAAPLLAHRRRKRSCQ